MSPPVSEPPRADAELWARVEAEVVPSDFWCQTHNAWTQNTVCDADCLVVGAYMRAADGGLPGRMFT